MLAKESQNRLYNMRERKGFYEGNHIPFSNWDNCLNYDSTIGETKCIKDNVKYLSPSEPGEFLSSPNSDLSIEEINGLIENLKKNMSFLELNKHRIRTDDYTQLMNNHQYAKYRMVNMISTKKVEMHNPYNINMRRVTNTGAGYKDSLNPFKPELISYTDTNGIIRVKNVNEFSQEYNEEWMKQFDQYVENPSVNTIPPQGCFKLN